ncbi:SRPBCC family protein [Sphingobacterium lactis]|uniref:Uncharacterized conserved protein YndB, AHSA1/START domain n=1 Tax=Sphingobacterium lactis TaxID=797291 RepID=A0A1H5UIG2_9SPHI|nr:SRPBCC domain-containing protein [Sphingobacterium lactis]SEF74843.1 Uncharacterized conserved protein YndB, AHSA1/START domain [Sphingobacterium lactis]
MSHDTILIERTYPISTPALWQAMTDKQKLKEWFFEIPDFSTNVGDEFEFSKSDKSPNHLHHCEVLEVIPNQLFKFSWRHPKQTKGISVISWQFIPRMGATTLRLVHEGLEHFKDAGEEYSQAKFESGWERILGEGLNKFVNKL